MRGKVSWLLVVALLCSGMVFAASPTDENIKKAKTGGYIVKKGKDAGKDSVNGDIIIQRVYDTITQGETNWHTREITGGNLMTVDLNWGTRAIRSDLQFTQPMAINWDHTTIILTEQ